MPTDGGGHKPEPELDRLSNILKTFNDQFGTLFTDADRVAKRIRDDIAPKVAADAAYQNAKENTPHTARMAHDQALGKVMQHLLKDDTQVYKQFVENESFKRFVGDMVYALTSRVMTGSANGLQQAKTDCGEAADRAPAKGPCRVSPSGIDDIETSPWVILRGQAGQMLSVAHRLGSPVPSRAGRGLIDTLIPTPRDKAHPRSLSKAFGWGALPFHSDAANWATPCRFVLLSGTSKEPIPTLLVSWAGLFSVAERAKLASAAFRVRNGRHSFFTTAFDTDRQFLRYDPGCMNPAEPAAFEAADLLHRRLRDAPVTVPPLGGRRLVTHR